jgi:hypothetical protein
MSITVAFGRWGLPYLISVGRWEWICVRSSDHASPGRRRWRIERSPGSDRQLSETIVHCGPVAHWFTRWPKPTPLPQRRMVSGQ